MEIRGGFLKIEISPYNGKPLYINVKQVKNFIISELSDGNFEIECRFHDGSFLVLNRFNTLKEAEAALENALNQLDQR